MVIGLSVGVTVMLIVPEFKLAVIFPTLLPVLATEANSVIFWLVPSKTMLISELLYEDDAAWDICTMYFTVLQVEVSIVSNTVAVSIPLIVTELFPSPPRTSAL